MLCDLYVGAATDEERHRIIQDTERLAHNDINVWRQAGPAVQKLLGESIAALSDEERAAVRPLVLKVAEQILDPEVEGATWHFRSVSLERGAVLPSETLALARGNALDMLFRMYDEAQSDKERREIFFALERATRLPGMATSGDALTNMILDETGHIVDFFTHRADTQQLELLQTIEHHFLWLYRRTNEIRDAQGGDRNEVAQKASAVITAIERFRDRANSREQFVRFKTLVGYESVFAPEWDGNPMDIEGRAAYRGARVAEYVASVTNDTADEWYEEIRRCASVQLHDGATFSSFCEFLKQLGSRSPAIMFAYLERGEDVLSKFLPAILEGLNQSEHWPTSLKLIERWVEQGRHLAPIARYLHMAKGAPADLLRKVGQKALDERDLIALIEVIAAVVASSSADLVDSIVVPGIRHFTTVGNTSWVNSIWFRPELDAFLGKMSEAQCEAIMSNLILSARIDYDEEKILKAVAEKFPLSVWRFFKSRLDHNQAGAAGRYEAIPYQLRELRKPLARDAELAVDTVRGWYVSDKRLFQFRGAKVLHTVFPEFSPELEAKLVSIVHEGTVDAIDFVLSVLRAYRGAPFLHTVCKEAVNSIPEDDGRLREIEAILSSTEVVWGQFGFVEAYQQKKQEAACWLNDNRPKVRAFAERYQRSLDRAIAAEQRRSEAEFELERREWPDEQH